MSHSDEKVLALGNTASVMPTIAKKVANLYVACPTNIVSPVLQGNEKCFAAAQLDFPLSVTCYRFVKSMSGAVGLFHAELGYAVACHSARVPYGAHIHGVTDIALLFPRTALGRVLKRPYRRALMGARYVVCHPAVLESIRALREDAVSLPLPVDTDQFNGRVEPFQLGEGASIFSPARMDQWKGHEIIWEALRLMKNKQGVTVYQSDWGWEPDYSRFRSSAPPNVKFIQVVPRERIAAYFRGATIVMGQMKIGYFGMTEVEAAACGVPVLVYLRDEESPFIPKGNDPQSLADAIDLLLQNERVRAEYARSCTDFVLRTCGLDAVTHEFLAAAGRPTDRGPIRGERRGWMATLFLGTCFELVGRLLGARVFGVLKSELIGL